MNRINQGQDEGQSGDPRALELADIQAKIRKMIAGTRGEVSSHKANGLGKSLVPTMAAVTIINFATGETKRPSTWTIRKLSEVAGYKLVFVPANTPLPDGSIEL